MKHDTSEIRIAAIMGVAGSGKTSLGRLVAEQLGWKLLDADSFHSTSNSDKMSRGEALTDEDRKPWLEALRAALIENIQLGHRVVLPCSALKQKYRNVLTGGPIENQAVWFYLKGSQELVAERLQARKSHFFDPALLDSQFATLEEPEEAVRLDIRKPIEELATEVIAELGRGKKEEPFQG